MPWSSAARRAMAAEVRGDVCRELDVPVLRRISGGAAVVVGPGCLMYALVLSLRLRPQLRSIDRAHAQVLGTIAAALRPSVPGLALPGHLRSGDRREEGFRQQRAGQTRASALSWHVAL